MSNLGSIFTIKWFKKLNQDAGSIGDVKHSLLTQAQFQEDHGTSWVLMDGRDVTGSKFQTKTGNSTIPDARGQFLRGKNNTRADGQEDPGGERNLGTQQTDAMQSHRHRSHGGNTGGGGSGLFTGESTASNFISVSVLEPSVDGANGVPRVDIETRSKNIAVNYFVKIN